MVEHSISNHQTIFHFLNTHNRHDLVVSSRLVWLLIWSTNYLKLEQLERLRSEDTPAASWLPTLLSHVGSQVKTRSNDLENIGQGQRSSHATHLLMLVIICTKYWKNPSRTVDATERTRFSRSRLNGLKNIGQGQRSFRATHPLMLMMICAKYGKNASRIVDLFSMWKPKILEFCFKINTRHTL